MCTVVDIYQLHNLGTFASCSSVKWNNMSRQQIDEEIKDLHVLMIDGIEVEVLDYSIDIPLFGGKIVSFRLQTDQRLFKLKLPTTIDA